MPLTTNKYRRGISTEERRRLIAILTELESRGRIEEVRKIRSQLYDDVGAFHTDENGYFVHRSGKKFIPIGQQAEFVNSNAFFILLYSSRGGGKTTAGAQKALKKLAAGYSGAILNPDFENMKASTWIEFREWIPWEAVVPRHRFMGEVGWEPHKPFTISFVNGASVRIKGLKDPSSARGPNINWLWYDEAGRDVDGLAWLLAIASVRVGANPQAWATSTPAGKFHWLYRFFFEDEVPEEVVKMFNELSPGRPLIETFYTSMQANINNLDPGYVAAMHKAYPKGYLRRQEVEGEFVSPEGSLGDEKWFDDKILPYAPLDVKRRIRYWDLAATEKEVKTNRYKKDPDETVGTLLSMYYSEGKPHFCIEDQIAGRWGWHEIKKVIREAALNDGEFVEVVIEQEPGAAGKNLIVELQSYLRDELGSAWIISGHIPSGDKVVRAQPWFGEAAAGQFYLVRGDWNRAFLDQFSNFPDAQYDDRVDSVSGARQYISSYKYWKSIKFLHLGSSIEDRGEDE